MHQRGFTLLELLLVMLMVSVFAAAAVPHLGIFTGSRPVMNSAAKLVAMTDYARSRSISEGRIYNLNVHSENGFLQVTAPVTSEDEMSETDYRGKIFYLPEGVTLKLMHSYAKDIEQQQVPGFRLPGYTDQLIKPAPGITVIPFYPDGRTQPAGFTFEDTRGNTVNVICRTHSSRFRVTGAGEEAYL